MRFDWSSLTLARKYSAPRPGEVDIWVGCASERVFAESMVLLCPLERVRALGYHCVPSAIQFVVARAMLRGLVGVCLNVDPRNVVFECDGSGKPRLEDSGQSLEVFFNVSHSHRLVLVALSIGRDVGVDIEYITDSTDCVAIARRFFHPNESNRVMQVCGRRRNEEFFRIWTMKEALLKGRGVALSEEGLSFEVAGANSGGLLGTNWCVENLEIPEGYAASVAYKGRPCPVRVWRREGD